MTEQTIIQVGNSLAVAIPKATAQRLGWKKGKKIRLEEDKGSKTITVSSESRTKTGLTPEFLAWTEETLKKNSKLMERLSKFHGK